MKVLEIKGGNPLTGTIRISGAKNSAVAIIPATILATEPVTICNVPEISDINALATILRYLGADIKRASETIIIDPRPIQNKKISQAKSSKLRASYYFMGALLGKYKKVEMYFPGGCSIGKRPINLHLKGFEALGATITEKDNKYTIEAKELKGAEIYLDNASVGATINIILAAVYATGKTVIDNAAKEPEIVNLVTFLNNMGAKISGAGTSTITIKGVKQLKGCFHEIIPDRIEAGTYTIMGALCGQNLKIDNIIPEHIDSLVSKLTEMGVEIEMQDDSLIISRPKKFKSSNVKTLPYPGFPTDLQSPIAVLLTQAKGKSIIEETIFENRFMYVDHLNKMGADIEKINERKVVIRGVSPLKGKIVEATDLRAGAAMIEAALIANGKTTIKNVEHILRGYEEIVEKLTNVGAKIEIKEI